jgi:hypothetical protein
MPIRMTPENSSVSRGGTAQSLRIITSGAGRKLRRRYVIAIHEEIVEKER